MAFGIQNFSVLRILVINFLECKISHFTLKDKRVMKVYRFKSNVYVKQVSYTIQAANDTYLVSYFSYYEVHNDKRIW